MSGLFDFLSSTYRTLAVWQWLVLAALPPLIVLLYFLKLKRQPLEVPSTYLWRRTLEDLHVNSLWQRLRQNLLLLLQLLVLLLAILTCLRPSWRGFKVDRGSLHLPGRYFGQHERDRCQAQPPGGREVRTDRSD